MTLASQGFNNSPTETETTRLRRFIKARETELRSVLAELQEEKEQLAICNNAISNLELAIPEGKEIIKAIEDNLVSLMALQSRLDGMKGIGSKAMKDEPTTKGLYTELRSCSETPVLRMSDMMIDEQIDALRQDVRTLWDKVRQLEMELSGWKSSKRLSESAIKRLNQSHSGIEVDLKAGREAFRPIWRMPSDAWGKIFTYVIQGTLDGYLKQNATVYGMRPPTFNLSQVSQRWRYLVHNDAELWRLVYVGPFQVWRYDENELVTKSLQKATAPITILTNLSQSFRWNYQCSRRFDQHGNYIAHTSPNESTLFNGKEYTLLVNMDYDDSTSMSRLSYIPLRQTSSLVFHGRYGIQYGYLFNYVSNFPNVKSLSIINDNPSTLPNVTISSYFSQLRNFTIQVKVFPSNFYLGSYLPNTLQELRLRNDAGGTLPIVNSNIGLPHLRILEITSPGSYLLDWLTAKGLRSLTLYSPSDYRGTQISSSIKATEIYGQLLHLKFEDWKSSETMDGSLGAAAVFRDLINKTPVLRTLTFSGCFVDGSGLVSTVEMVMADSEDPAKNRKLEEITLSYPTGITNDQCGELIGLVKRLKIYM
ncbi:hypothetical protein CPB86DRAFT_828454 [Serendipita vermifera]|nr:hypothetical protein CPB86DRAFT_828454 [Serendipita vermifera]